MKDKSYKQIRNEVAELVKQACFRRKNYFGGGTWECHIVPVVKHSLKLGEKLKADLKVLELAALLHDYANLVNAKKYEKEHHVHGAMFAEKILKEYNYPKEKIEHIKDCIISHRGSVKVAHKTIESRILASADAMSHISELADMFFLTFGIHKFGSRDGSVWLRNKLRRGWKKTMKEGKEIVREEYLMAMKILNRNIKNIR